MTLKIYDISNHQQGLLLSSLVADGFIMKATQGAWYTDEYCDGFMNQAIKLNKLTGIYHFLEKGNGKKQAEYFIKETKGYINKGNLIALDFESYLSNGVTYKPSVQDCVDFVDEYIKQTGVIPVLYMNESDANYYDWSPIIKRNCGLWVAKYSSQQPILNQWSFYMMWQFTSSPYDTNEFYGDKDTWFKYAKSGNSLSNDNYYRSGTRFKAKQDIVIMSDTSWTKKTGLVIHKGYEFDISKINTSGNTTNGTLLNNTGVVTLHKDYVELIK